MDSRELGGPQTAPQRAAARAAWPLLCAHVVLILFSTLALTTFLAGPPPSWLQSPTNQRILALGWQFSGPAYVTVGALAALTHAAARLGWPRAWALFAAAYAISLTAELIGTGTGYPFGPYSYTPLLGYLVGGRVPFPIPLSWFFMVYSALAVCARVLPPPAGWLGTGAWAVAGGAVLTAWDVALDPAMTAATTHWVWHVKGVFYGMPLSNWFGWWLTGTLVAGAMLAIVRPPRFVEEVGPSRLPLALYAINGVMPIALCIRHGLWWAALGGALAMGVPLTLAVRRRAPASRGAGLRTVATAGTLAGD